MGPKKSKDNEKLKDDGVLMTSPSNDKVPSPLARVRSLRVDDEREMHIVEDEEHQKELERLHPEIYSTFNVTIKGSPEHVKALREARDHHTSKSQQLQNEYPEAISQYQKIRNELDKLSKDLNELSPTRNVHLEANFGKFGYSANIKQRTLFTSTEEHEGSTTMKIYKAPIIRQYFYKGLLWRAADKEEVASFELFVDLLYVGILAVNGDRALEEPTGDALLRFSFTFIMSWRIWTDITLMVSWFETDDMIQRVGILTILACLVGFTTNIVSSTTTTYSQLIAFYLAARLYGMFILLFMAWVISIVRPIMLLHSAMILFPSALWIASTHVEEPNRWILIWFAIFLDTMGPHFTIIFIRGPAIFGTKVKKWSQDTITFYPAVNIEHRTERTGAFVSLVFGYAVVALLYQNQASFGMNAIYGKAVLGLIQSFCFNTIYFDIDASNHYQHAIRRHAITSLLWLSAHLPFIMGFTLSGAALSRLVIAHDCRDAELEDLTEAYQDRSLAIVEAGIRWFYCGGLSIALLCLAIISACHYHTVIETQRLRKLWRLLYRCLVALVWILLPLAGERLSSLSLLSITTGMIVSVLILDIYGTSCRNESFFSFQKDCKRCYKAKLGSGTNTTVGSSEDLVNQVMNNNLRDEKAAFADAA